MPSDAMSYVRSVMPMFLIVIVQGPNIVISFPSQAGFNYQAEYTTNLTDGSWVPLGNAVSGNNFMESAPNSGAAQARFYRVQIE